MRVNVYLALFPVFIHGRYDFRYISTAIVPALAAITLLFVFWGYRSLQRVCRLGAHIIITITLLMVRDKSIYFQVLQAHSYFTSQSSPYIVYQSCMTE